MRDSVRSNKACNQQIPITYVPNAFSPFGYHPVFYPINVFADVSSYSFRVFNRWGELIFESNDPNAGWDGAFKNKKSQPGVYAYFITYVDNKGNKVKKKGTVTLLL